MCLVVEWFSVKKSVISDLATDSEDLMTVRQYTGASPMVSGG